jgi:hypothetical protein
MSTESARGTVSLAPTSTSPSAEIYNLSTASKNPSAEVYNLNMASTRPSPGVSRETNPSFIKPNPGLSRETPASSSFILPSFRNDSNGPYRPARPGPGSPVSETIRIVTDF